MIVKLEILPSVRATRKIVLSDITHPVGGTFEIVKLDFVHSMRATFKIFKLKLAESIQDRKVGTRPFNEGNVQDLQAEVGRVHSRL